MRTIHPRSLRKDKKAVSPAISTVIMIAAVMVLIFVAMSYANTVLDTRLAENEFGANQQFMVSTGLQIDDVAWTVGRTQTISYASRYGSVKYQPLALNYSVELHSITTGEWESVPQLSNLTTGMIMYNMPISEHNMGNNYFERVEPRNDASFLQSGATAPVSQVFVVEQLPMDDGSFIRIVAVPSIRTLNSSITSESGSTVYYKFFLPTLTASSENPALSQSVTMVGNNVNKTTLKLSNVDRVRVTVDFPSAESEFNLAFFGWNPEDRTVETPVEPNSVVEFYVGMVNVSIGLP
jgi:hypothetical protein